MVRGLLLAGAFLAMSAFAGQASAAFVLIDNFKPGGAEGGARNVMLNVGFANPGVATFSAPAFGNAILTIDSLTPGVLSGATGLRLSGFQALSGSGSVLAGYSNNGGATFTTVVGVASGSGLNFTFANLAQFQAADTLIVQAAASGAGGFSFAANGLYAVPEPATMAMVGLAAAGGGLGFIRRRKKATV